MKKLFLLLLIAPVLGFGQVLTDVFYVWQKFDDESINGNLIPINNTSSDQYFLGVPDDKLWVIERIQTYFYYGSEWRYKNSQGIGDNIFLYIHSNPAINTEFISQEDFQGESKMRISHSIGEFIPSGTKFYFNPDYYDGRSQKSIIQIKEYSLENNSLSYNESETIQNNSNTPALFPNPTSSLLALNSDKEYDIEVYDMAGNKVMALTGNTIDMSHLSSATYIVKALDKVENEEVSYKVVKN